MRRFLTALVVALVLLAGCAGADTGGDSGEPDSVELADQSGSDAGDGGDGGDGGERPEQSGDAGAGGDANAAVQERLSDVQGEIERLEAQKRSLEDRVAYSTLRIELREPQPEGTTREVTPFHEQSPLSALNNSVATLVQVLRTLFLLGVIAAPWLAVAAIPVGIAGVLAHRFVGGE